jgi:hypothetical protein
MGPLFHRKRHLRNTRRGRRVMGQATQATCRLDFDLLFAAACTTSIDRHRLHPVRQPSLLACGVLAPRRNSQQGHWRIFRPVIIQGLRGRQLLFLAASHRGKKLVWSVRVPESMRENIRLARVIHFRSLIHRHDLSRAYFVEIKGDVCSRPLCVALFRDVWPLLRTRRRVRRDATVDFASVLAGMLAVGMSRHRPTDFVFCSGQYADEARRC